MENQEYIHTLIERHKKQLERIRKYNHEHKAELNAKSRAYFQKIKANHETYEKYLANKRKHYWDKKNKLPVVEENSEMNV